MSWPGRCRKRPCGNWSPAIEVCPQRRRLGLGVGAPWALYAPDATTYAAPGGPMRGGEMATLVVDVGGNNVKLRCEGYDDRRKAPSGPDYRPEQLLEDVQRLAADWNYTRISIGCPGPVANNRVVRDLVNLGPGWMEFDFTQAFGVPVRLVNDAVMQAIGSYEGGKMLFLGLGTGLGNTMIVDGTIIPMELGHLPYRKDHTYEDYVGNRGLEKRGRARWEAHVHKVVRLFQEALLIDDVVLGGGNARKLKELPKGCRIGDNENAFIGGFRLWDDQA